MGDDHSGGQPGGPASKALERFRSEIGTDEKATWVPYTGPEGGEGWQNLDTGDIEYTDDPPGQTPDPDDIPDEDLEQLADEAGVEGADAEEIRDALKEELGEREADGGGTGGGTGGFDADFEEGDTVRVADDAGNERQVEIEDINKDGVRADIAPGSREGDVRNLDPDEWDVEENVSASDDNGDGGDALGGRGTAPDDLANIVTDLSNSQAEELYEEVTGNAAPPGAVEANVLRDDLFDVADTEDIEAGLEDLGFADDGGDDGSGGDDSGSDYSPEEPATTTEERAEVMNNAEEGDYVQFSNEGEEPEVRQFQGTGPTGAGLWEDPETGETFATRADSYDEAAPVEGPESTDDGTEDIGGDGDIDIADPDEGPAGDGEVGDPHAGANETAAATGEAIGLASDISEDEEYAVVNTLDAMDDPSDQDVANVLDEVGVYDNVAGEVYGDILADNGVDLPKPDTGGGGSDGDDGGDGGDGGETEPGDDYDPLVDMDDEDAIKEQIDNIMAGSDPQTVDEIAFQLSRADQPTESDVAEAAELAGFRGPDKDRTVDQLTAELGLPYDDALDQNAEPADPVDGQVSKARARYERLRARQREQNAGAAGVSEKAGAGLGPSARFKLLVSVKNWVPYEGPMGGEGWQNIDSGEVSYDDEPPGAAPDPDKIPDEDLEAFAEENGIDAEPEELRDTLREELADRGAPGSGGGDFGADDTQDPTDLLEDNLPTGGGMDMSPLRSTDDAAQEAADIHNDFVLDEIDKDEYEERAREWAEEHGMADDADGGADDAGSGSDTAEVGSHHLVTNPMTGDRMDAEVTGEPTVPRGSESGEEQYPVEFENGDSGYVPRDEVEPQEPDTEDVNAVADAVMDEVLGNEGLIDYGTISEVASSDLTDVEATPELVDEVAEVFDVEQNAETQDPVEGQVEKARSFIESRRGD